MLQEIIDLTSELVKKDSVSPNDSGCLDLINPILRDLDFKVEEMDFDDTKNIWATHGVGSPLIVFAGHTDVVPTGDISNWTKDPFTPVIEGDKLYGRGTTDMKGGVVAMLIATKHYIKQNPNHQGTIAFLITSDEEAMATNGTVKVVEKLAARNVKIDYCIVGEPSSERVCGDTIMIGRRGSITGNLNIKGIQGHIAFPNLSDNPIHKSLQMLEELINIKWDKPKSNVNFAPTSLQIANIHAGTGAENIIPPELFVQFNLRYSIDITAEEIKQKVEQLLNKYNLEYAIEWWHSGIAFLSKQGKLTENLATIIEEQIGQAPNFATFGGTSDARFINDICDEVVEIGTRNHTMHKIDEFVYLEDLDQISKIYKRILEKLL